MIARLTLASIRNELDTLARATGVTITIERTDKDGNETKHGRYVTAFLPSGASFTGVICATLAEARNSIRQYLAQTGIVPSSDTFPTNNLVAAIAAATISPVNTDLAILRVKYDEMCATWARHGVAPTRQDVADLIGNLHSRGIVSDATLHNRETIARDLMTSEAPDPEPPAPTYPRTVSTDTAHLVNVLKAHGFTLAQASTNLIDQMTERDADTRWMNTAGDLVVISPSRNRLDIGRHDATWGDLSTLIYIDGHITSVTFFDQNTQAGDLAYLFATNPEPPAPTLATETVAADTEYIVTLSKANERSIVTRNGMPIHWKQMGDAIQSAKNILNASDWTGYTVTAMPENVTVAEWSAPDYTTIPAIGGGSQEADTTPATKPARKPRNQATSQKRDNQRAERARINDAYHAAAEQRTKDVSDVLQSFGFTIASEKVSGETPVTLWHDADGNATIKQTPYSLRIYNGQPARLPRHGDAELINRVEHGWCASGEPRGYAAGLADAILRLIETPDPLMQALDAMEAKQAGESSPAVLTDDDMRTVTDDVRASEDPITARCKALLDMSETVYRAHQAGMSTDDIATVIDRHLPELPALVLHGGQPSMSGPWQAERDTPRCNACGTPTGDARYTYCNACTGRDDTAFAAGHYHDDGYHGMIDAVPAISGGSHDECPHDDEPARFCSQCGHDAHPDAPQPTDTGTSHDVLPLTQKYTRKALEKKCAEASAILGKHVEVVQEPVSKRYAVTEDLPERMRNNPGDWLRERDCNTIRYWIEHLNAEIRKHRARMSATDTGTSHDVTTPSDPDTGDRVTIEHTPEGGTIATGDTRPQSATLKMCGFKWSRQLGAWYIPNSRDRRADMYKINKTAQALRDNHASVTLDIDDRAVDPATAEANRAERLADRHAALHRKAEKLDAEATARFGAADTLADMIPFGQPILVGHHSEQRHRNHVAKIERNMDKGVQAFRASEDAAHRATAGERQQAKRLTAPATMRRIEKLETERRDLERRAARGQVGTIGGPTIAERLSDNAEHLAYWRAHLATLEAQGVKVWRPEDFTKGDVVLDQFGLVTVNRVNKKSLSVTTHYTFDHGREWSRTVTFDDIKGKATPEQAERFRTA